MYLVTYRTAGVEHTMPVYAADASHAASFIASHDVVVLAVVEAQA